MSVVPLYPPVDVLGVWCRPVSFGVTQSTDPPDFVSHTVFSNSFCRGRIPHKSVDVFFRMSNIKNRPYRIADLWGS